MFPNMRNVKLDFALHFISIFFPFENMFRIFKTVASSVI